MFLFIITPADLQMTSFSPTSTCFHSPARGPPQSSMSVGFYWPANQTSHYLLSTCSARKVWNHFRKTLQGNVQTTAPARGKLWQLAVESGTCKVILGMQVKRQHGKGKKNPPSLTLEAFTPEAKPGKNMPGIPLHLFQLKLN